jgi:hypothetical protein
LEKIFALSPGNKLAHAIRLDIADSSSLMADTFQMILPDSVNSFDLNAETKEKVFISSTIFMY